MRTVLINVKKSDMIFLLNLFGKLGMSAKVLSGAKVKNWKLAQKIGEGMKSSSVSRNRVMKVLKK